MLQNPVSLTKKPSWLKVKAPSGETYQNLRELLLKLGLATVCQEARCPNIGECWGGGTATIMIMGDTCTRGCRFCHVKTGNPHGLLDASEPEKVAFAVSQMTHSLNYIVITSVNRDDLPDQGAAHFARTIRAIKSLCPEMLIEILTPDFRGHIDCVKTVVEARPDVFAHNLETVPRLQKTVRDPRANYQQSLSVLRGVKELDSHMITKTSLMLGLGEDHEEILSTLRDLRAIQCDVVTFGQYLQPTKKHLPVKKFYSPEEFQDYKKIAEDMGFLYVASGPLVRSSYRAGEFFMASAITNKKKEKDHVNHQIT
ncbi:MAG: lipoyl synthase [Bdellovibrionaceae bacterium]|nr:lipoyl synthase [Pseudobdellovibrionaceae bacterium]MDW8190442.1 lipoyl synthase [Pseudobdellovibrionaceae bacterium]